MKNCVAILLIMALAMLIVASASDAQTQTDKKWTTTELERTLKGMSKAQVKELLGPPHDVQGANTWVYKGLSIEDTESGFTMTKVYINFDPPPRGVFHITFFKD